MNLLIIIMWNSANISINSPSPAELLNVTLTLSAAKSSLTILDKFVKWKPSLENI